MSVINHKGVAPKVVAGRVEIKKKQEQKSPPYLLWLVFVAAVISLLFVIVVGFLLLRTQFPPIQSPQEQYLLFPPPTRSELPQPTKVAINLTPLPITETVEPTKYSAESQQMVSTATLSPVATLKLITATPVATETEEESRPDGEIVVFELDKPFEIDAELSGWSNFPPYPIPFTVFSRNDWDGTSDIEAYWRLAWDHEYLYIGTVVVDDIHVQTQSGKHIFLGDSLELQIDTNPLANAVKLNPSTYQLILSPGDFKLLPPSAHQFQATTQGQMLELAYQPQTKVAALPTKKGYVLETAIAWRDLGVAPSADLVLGIALNINDNDTPNSARQEVMKSHVSNREYSNPTTWGSLRLKRQP